mmetsp:Transcript_1200/g.1827  ORF Transcript_1200/g.1827 Transcript_1200/m.1827 type:complete len:856 (+) Transcript_1200:75-2642(+)
MKELDSVDNKKRVKDKYKTQQNHINAILKKWRDTTTENVEETIEKEIIIEALTHYRDSNKTIELYKEKNLWSPFIESRKRKKSSTFDLFDRLEQPKKKKITTVSSLLMDNDYFKKDEMQSSLLDSTYFPSSITTTTTQKRQSRKTKTLEQAIQKQMNPDIHMKDTEVDQAIEMAPSQGLSDTYSNNQFVVNSHEVRELNEDVLQLPKPLEVFLKEHQKEGIQFMWNKIGKTVPKNSRGCILAHSMGLGKTLQAITLTYLFLKRANRGKTTLIVCPSTVVLNWVAEFEKWTKKKCKLVPALFVYTLEDQKKSYQRTATIEAWKQHGGVFIVSYSMFGRLVGDMYDQTRTSDVEQAAFDQLRKIAFTHFVDPGPDLMILDEGHILKKVKAKLTQTFEKVTSPHRIILTGTPLQNHLQEYWTMINFIKPHYWSEDFFKLYYADPILEGMKKDSSAYDVSMMQKRSYLLVKKLSQFVNRKDVSILMKELPKKHEFVIHIGLSPLQHQLYKDFIETIKEKSFKGKIFLMFHTTLKTVNHPDLVLKMLNKQGFSKDDIMQQRHIYLSTKLPVMQKESSKKQALNSQYFKWALPLLEPSYEQKRIEHSTKMSMTMSIIDAILEQNEKLLIFTQFTQTLDILEAAFNSRNFKVNGDQTVLKRDIHYFRIDGAIQGHIRQSMIKRFNRPSHPVKIFLISTKSGGIGINLTGASRVILYDILWDPTFNRQAIFRTYRYGQTKPVYIYRFVSKGTLEEALWKRCCAKMWLFERVVNNSIPARTLTMDDLDLYKDIQPEEPLSNEKRQQLAAIIKEDVVLSNMFAKDHHIIKDICEFDSLYHEDLSDKLSERQKAEAEAELAMVDET